MIIVGQAKGLLSDYQPKYNSARAVYRERKKYVDEIDWNMLAVPPTGSYKARRIAVDGLEEAIGLRKGLVTPVALQLWWGNPQRIDNALSNKRIIFTYEQVE
ncbi:hypothetical protein Pint_17118 [Pistacia integerrima]|uniref:Uncharacterized protein n=1 Tax=Pistacia integerrima TaxID=434235 RepID=A0ACC0YWG4_9ROSI|nr:hypothetical protein Pint_17118 [Pistacia integerrima]